MKSLLIGLLIAGSISCFAKTLNATLAIGDQIEVKTTSVIDLAMNTKEVQLYRLFQLTYDSARYDRHISTGTHYTLTLANLSGCAYFKNDNKESVLKELRICGTPETVDDIRGAFQHGSELFELIKFAPNFLNTNSVEVE